MKRFNLKFAVGLLALVIGVVIVWASGIIQMLTPAPAKSSSSSTANETLEVASPTGEESNKIVIRFKGFELYKGWVAKFEIANYTAKPITYIGFKDKGEFDFCTLAAQREEIWEPSGNKARASGTRIQYHCLESKAVILQTVMPGERIVFSVFKNDVQDLVTLRGKYKNAQIGFEFFVDDEKRREMLWSEDITFPDDEN